MIKKSQTILALLFIAASLSLSNCQGKQQTTAQATAQVETSAQSSPSTLKVGVVSMDSLQLHYQYYLDANKKLEELGKRNEKSIAAKAQQAQQAYSSYMEKGQKGLFTSQEQVNAAEQRITALQQEGMRLEQQLQKEFIEAQMSSQQALHDEVKKQIELFNADRKYDLILTYSGLTGVMYAGETMDITQEVIDFLNNAYKAKADKKVDPEADKADTKKK